MGINTCLYCNRNHIHYDFGKKFGTTLDHFYDKATYPYLALSFHNLIPSCNTCNSSQGKGSKPFSLETHLHPYEKGFEGILRFNTNITKLEDLIDDNNKDIDIVFKEIPDTNLGQAKNNVADFALDKQYKVHKDLVRDFLKLGIRYYSNPTVYDYTGLFKDKMESIRIMLGGLFIDEKDLHKEVLSKLKRDIAIEYFGLEELKHLKS